MRIIYISDYPVKYHAETISEICKQNDIIIDQLYISNYRHINEQNFQDQFEFKFINNCVSDKKPSFLSFCFNLKFLKRMQDYDLIWMHGYNHLHLVLLPLFINFFHFRSSSARPKVIFRGELSCLSEDSGVIKRFVKRQYFKFFDAFFFIGAANYLFIRHELKAKGLYYFLPYSRTENFGDLRISLKGSADVNFLSVGRLENRKNHLEFLEYISNNLEIIRNALQRNVKITLVGDGPLYKKIEDWKKENLVEGLDVVLKGRLEGDELRKEYKLADFFFLVSHREPYGMVCSEAKSFGLPMILSREVGAGYDYVDGISNIWFDRGADNAAVTRFIVDRYHNSGDLSYRGFKESDLAGVKYFFNNLINSHAN